MSQKITECNWNITKGLQDARGISQNIAVHWMKEGMMFGRLKT